MPYLIDSDIMIDLSCGSVPAAQYVDSRGDWSVSVVTGLELLAGAKDRREVAEIDLVLGGYRVVPTNPEIGQLAYNLMKTYSKSNGLDPCDALIAATAIYEGLKLATKNDKHFEAISGLEVEDSTRREFLSRCWELHARLPVYCIRLSWTPQQILRLPSIEVTTVTATCTNFVFLSRRRKGQRWF
jgi:predicted nucleic acid-binding protein